jgi:hypothetical protein
MMYPGATNPAQMACPGKGRSSRPALSAVEEEEEEEEEEE